VLCRQSEHTKSTPVCHPTCSCIPPGRDHVPVRWFHRTFPHTQAHQAPACGRLDKDPEAREAHAPDRRVLDPVHRAGYLCDRVSDVRADVSRRVGTKRHMQTHELQQQATGVQGIH